MPFDPTIPATGSPIVSAELRNQFNALNDQLVAASAALDWSNGAPKLPDFTTINNPVLGNLAYDYNNEALVVYAHGEWVQLT